MAHIRDADIRPIEECGICGADFDTSQPHAVVVLERCHDTLEKYSVDHVEYASRCCPRCISSGHAAYRRLLEEWTSLGAGD